MKNAKPGDRSRTALSVFFLFVLTLGIFAYSVEIRRPWFGDLSLGHHQWLSGSTIKFTKNWLHEGPLALRFLMLENPASVELPTLASRQPYLSYPPGAIVPFYLLCRLRGAEPEPARLMNFNLLNHFLVAFSLALLVFVLLRQLHVAHVSATLLATVPIMAVLLTPGPLYWHQNVFFSDQAVILPFALFALLEVWRDQLRGRSARIALAAAQGVVTFIGVLTDWLFVVVTAVVYTKRLLNGELGKGTAGFLVGSGRFLAPAVAALGLFAYQLYDQNAFEGLLGIYLARAGVAEVGAAYAQRFPLVFWQRHIATAYGQPAVALLWAGLLVFVASTVYLLARRLRGRTVNDASRKITNAGGILLVPCFIQVYALQNHSVIHDFSTLKFALPYAVVPFVLLPLLVGSFFGADIARGISLRRVSVRAPVFAIVMVVTAAALVMHEHPRFRKFFPRPNPEVAQLGRFVAENTGYRDIVFSPQLEIKNAPPQLLSYSMKLVYKTGSVADISRTVGSVQDAEYVVNILVQSASYNVPEYVSRLTAAAYTVRDGAGYRIYKIAKADYLRLTQARDR